MGILWNLPARYDGNRSLPIQHRAPERNACVHGKTCEYDRHALACADHAGCVCPQCGAIHAFCQGRELEGLETQLEIRLGVLRKEDCCETEEGSAAMSDLGKAFAALCVCLVLIGIATAIGLIWGLA